MHVASYAETVARLQPTVPVVFDALQHGLNVTRADHEAKRLARSVDQHFFAHSVRRVACDQLRAAGLLVTNAGHERSALSMSGMQLDHNGVRLWLFRSERHIPLPNTPRKRAFYRQTAALDEWDNVLVLWRDFDSVFIDPMRLVRPLGGDHRRCNLRVDWDGPLSRRMAGMRAEDLDELSPTYAWQQMMAGDLTS